jgi:pyruvate/2-oxoglutarate dehydrogenase complex dihydrolipoamide dehydrogenase (E3) component
VTELIMPDTAENRKLVSNVHPADWSNPQPTGRYNLVVIGGGTAGLVCAAGAAGLGAKVALIERHLLGGDCLNMGCVPSKALIRASRAVHDVRSAGAFGILVGEAPTVDFAVVMERMRRLRSEISSHDSARRFRDDLGVDVYFGAATFVESDCVTVNGTRLFFHRAAICSGARAASLPIPGLAESGYLTNESVFELTELPPRLAVIGGGPIGCELAQAFARFGSRVTIIEQAPQILGREDHDASGILHEALVREGIELQLGAKISAIERHGNERLVNLEIAGHSRTLIVDQILIGVGRSPNVSGLNLEKAGVAYDQHNGIDVDETMQTTNPRIYAAGDVCSPFKFTHTADAQARIVIANALFKGRQKSTILTIPWCTYTDPEIAHVGMYEQEAIGKGLEVTTLTISLTDVDRAVLDGDTDGFARVHLKKGSDRILGATIVARHAGEMINELSLAITSGLGLSAIGKTIHPYPTQAEVIRKLADAYNRTRLTPFVKKVLAAWLKWQRAGR